MPRTGLYRFHPQQTSTSYTYTVRVESGQAVATRHDSGCQTVTGYSITEYESDPMLWIKMVPPEDQPIVIEQACKLLHGRPDNFIEHRVIHKNGQIRKVRNTPVVHQDAHGHLMGYSGIVNCVPSEG